jgi:hypothetical protein
VTGGCSAGAVTQASRPRHRGPPSPGGRVPTRTRPAPPQRSRRRRKPTPSPRTGVRPHFQRGRNRDPRRPWLGHGEKSRLPMTAAPGHPDRQTFTQPARAAGARFPDLSWRSDRPLGGGTGVERVDVRMLPSMPSPTPTHRGAAASLDGICAVRTPGAAGLHPHRLARIGEQTPSAMYTVAMAQVTRERRSGSYPVSATARLAPPGVTKVRHQRLRRGWLPCAPGRRRTSRGRVAVTGPGKAPFWLPWCARVCHGAVSGGDRGSRGWCIRGRAWPGMRRGRRCRCRGSRGLRPCSCPGTAGGCARRTARGGL